MADLDGIKGAIKLAAIDAAMRQRDYVVSGGSYRYITSGIPGEVTRPDESTGNGGGQVLHIPAEHIRSGVSESMVAQLKKQFADSLEEQFASIRSSVDGAFAPWYDIPVASDFEQLEIDCSRLVASMMGGRL